MPHWTSIKSRMWRHVTWQTRCIESRRNGKRKARCSCWMRLIVEKVNRDMSARGISTHKSDKSNTMMRQPTGDSRLVRNRSRPQWDQPRVMSLNMVFLKSVRLSLLMRYDSFTMAASIPSPAISLTSTSNLNTSNPTSFQNVNLFNTALINTSK